MPSERARVIGLLDAFQAAERVGAEAVARWIASCSDDRLRAGLRVIRTRDRRHAALAEGRLRELGGEPLAQVSRDLAAVCGVVADPDVSDRSKIDVLLGACRRRPNRRLAEFARTIEADAETRALFESIAADERSSLRWLRRIRAVLADGPT
jgi:hypothetical protein